MFMCKMFDNTDCSELLKLPYDFTISRDISYLTETKYCSRYARKLKAQL